MIIKFMLFLFTCSLFNVPSKPLMINYLSDDRFYTVGKFQDREVYITYHILKCVSYTSIIYDKL